MRVLGVIPARFGSTRFPGKPLARETGKYLIQHVFERAMACRLFDRIIVATDDRRIVQAVTSFGGEVELTGTDHPSGTSRVAEVAARQKLAPDDIVVNVQGDEPDIAPEGLGRLIERLKSESAGCRIATLAAPFGVDGPREGPGSPIDPNCVKVAVGAEGRALYFSRSLVPYPRDTGGRVDDPSRWLLHLGVYAYRWDVLKNLPGLSTELRALARAEPGIPGARIRPKPIIVGAGEHPESLERMEGLEQLGWLGHGLAIAVEIVAEASVGIDTPQDYDAFVKRTAAAALRPLDAPRGAIGECP